VREGGNRETGERGGPVILESALQERGPGGELGGGPGGGEYSAAHSGGRGRKCFLEKKKGLFGRGAARVAKEGESSLQALRKKEGRTS